MWPSAPSSFKIFSSLQKKISYLLSSYPKPLAITYLLSLCIYLFWIFHINGIIKCVLSCNIFNINSCYSIYLHSFLLMNIIPLYTCITVVLPIYLLMHIALFPPFLAIVNTATENITVHGCLGGFQVFGYFMYQLEEEFLGHLVILCLTFWGTSKLFKLFSMRAAWFHIPISTVDNFQFLYVLANTCYFTFFKSF